MAQRHHLSMGAKSARHSLGVVGEHMIAIEKKMATGYRIGSLEQARQAFCNTTNLTIKWQPEGDIEEIP
jgi:hypothetical protein